MNDPWLVLKVLAGIGSLTLVFLLIRHLLLRYGVRKSGYPRVQHSEKKAIRVETEPERYLPGSKVSMGADTREIEFAKSVMEKGLQVTQLDGTKKKKKKHPIVRDLMDIKRAIILDDLLDRKWNK